MKQANSGKAVLGGFIATVVMTMMIYLAPHMGMPNMDIAAMLGSMMNGGKMPAVMSTMWLVGLMVHFILGTFVFSLIYAFFIYRLIPGMPWVRGVVWGLILWLIMMVMPLPMLGRGFFGSKTPNPILFDMGILIGHIVYGAILGAVSGRQAENTAL